MRILYIDIDSLRHDHLKCYGYHRDTAPNIESIAQKGVRFNNIYVSDAPCLPSRTALCTGRFGIHTGVCNHHGTAADLFVEGPPLRKFQSTLGNTSWAVCLQNANYRTVTFSPFGKRHSAFWWYSGFDECHSYGSPGSNVAHMDAGRALEWLEKNGKEDNWFMHLNFWDVHFPFRTPENYGNPFADQPAPAWYNEEVRQKLWQGCGPTSAQDLHFLRGRSYSRFARQPSLFESMDAVKLMFDSYDTSIRYVDDHLGKIFDCLRSLGIEKETAIVLTADHGEDLGEMNVHCDHRLADEYCHHVPLIVHWPGITDKPDLPRTDDGLHYHIDMAATILDWAGAQVPQNWDGKSFAQSFVTGNSDSQPYLVLTYGGTASVQRAVRFDQAEQAFYCIRSYHDGWHGFPDVMLFELNDDPHLQNNIAETRPEIVDRSMYYLTEWQSSMMRSATHPVDPIWTALQEGCQDMVLNGPDLLDQYVEHLNKTDRKHHAKHLLEKRKQNPAY